MSKMKRVTISGLMWILKIPYGCISKSHKHFWYFLESHTNKDDLYIRHITHLDSPKTSNYSKNTEGFIWNWFVSLIMVSILRTGIFTVRTFTTWVFTVGAIWGIIFRCVWLIFLEFKRTSLRFFETTILLFLVFGLIFPLILAVVKLFFSRYASSLKFWSS